MIARRPLGRTGLSVTTLGFGSAPLGDLYEKLDDQTAIDTVATALRSGPRGPHAPGAVS